MIRRILGHNHRFLTMNIDFDLTPSTEVFLTGGTGFVGSHLRTAFADEGIPLTLLVRDGTTVSTRDNESIQEGDIINPESFDVCGHDIVLHLAAQTSIQRAVENPSYTWRVNADGTCNILEASREAEIDRFLFFSTASVYGKPEYLPIDESHPTEPTEPYGASKLAGDALVRSYGRTFGLSTTIIRLFNIFGPGQSTHNVVPTILNQALTGDTVELGNLSPSRDFIYVKDALRAVAVILQNDTTELVYNVGTGSDTTILEMAKQVSNILDNDFEIVSTTARERDDDIEIPRHVADISRLRSLGWTKKYEVRDGLKETIAASTKRP